MGDTKNVYAAPPYYAEPLGDGNVIVQRNDGYRFGSDAVALAHYAEKFVTWRDNVVDLCSGCGIIGIMLAISTKASVVGAELDGDAVGMARRSAAINRLGNIEFFNTDIRCKDVAWLAPLKNTTDIVVCNPPFYKSGSAPKSVAPRASVELTVTFSDVVKVAAALLKNGGAFAIVHTCSRLDEILRVCADHGLAPKDLVVNTNGKTFILKCIKGGKSGMTVSTAAF